VAAPVRAVGREQHLVERQRLEGSVHEEPSRGDGHIANRKLETIALATTQLAGGVLVTKRISLIFADLTDNNYRATTARVF